MNKNFELFKQKTERLLLLLDFFYYQNEIPETIQFDYRDFYLKNIISNNYTNFENYLRDSFSSIVEKISTISNLNSSILSDDLRVDIIRKCLSQFPSTVDSRILNGRKKDLSKRLFQMLNEDMYLIHPEEHSFHKLPHSTADIEKLLCKYLNQKSVLYQISFDNSTTSMNGLELINDITAYAYLNQYIGDLRHPIVHEGIIVYMNQELSVDYYYVKDALGKFLYITEQLTLKFEDYYQQILLYSSESEQNQEESMIGS